MKGVHLKLGILAVVVMGLLYVWPILALIFCLLGALSFFLSRYDRGERRVLSKIIWLGLTLRIGFTFVAILCVQLLYVEPEEFPLLMKLVGNGLQLFRDFGREVVNGVNIGNFLSGQYGSDSIQEVEKLVAHEGRLTFLHFGAYFQGALNYIFGQSLLNILVYPFIGVVPILLVYLISRDIFNERVAFLSSAIMAFLPSNIIWSCINVRMTIATSAFLLFAWSLMKFYQRNHLKYLIPFAVSVWCISFSKGKFLEPFLFSTIALWVWSLSFIQKRKWIILSGLLCIGIGVSLFFPGSLSKLDQVKIRILETQISYYSMPSGNNYRIYDDTVYASRSHLNTVPWSDVIKGIPKGVAYFMFAPFPWKTTNSLRLFSYPQTVLWYILFLFSLYGCVIGLRHREDRTMLLMMFVTFWVLLLSLVLGNVGTSARHRDLVLPILYIFSSVGILQFLSLVSARERVHT